MYSSEGLSYLIEIFAVNLQLMFTEILVGVQWIPDHKFATIVLILFCLSLYSALHRQSDAFKTMSDVFPGQSGAAVNYRF
jgi:hypothetical protein